MITNSKRRQALDDSTRGLLRKYVGTLPAMLQGAIPADWTRRDLPFDPKPYAPLVASYFGIRDRETIAAAAAAGLMMELYCCLQDARIDGHEWAGSRVSEPLGNLLVSESLARFEEIAGDAAALRPHVQRAFVELAKGYWEEQRPAEEQDHFRSVTNRAAPFHILIAAFGLRSGQPEKIEPCSQLARHLLFWFQIQDDLEDWEEDLAKGRRSYLLHRLAPLVGTKEFGEWTAAEVENALYLYGGAEMLIDDSVRELEQAGRFVGTSRLLRRLLGGMLSEHRKLRGWCLERKREFLRTAA